MIAVPHHIYHTEGIILSSINIGESNRFLFVLTKDLGLVGVTAQGVRELKSKLRYSLQTLSHAYLDLVRGKEVWRVTSAGELHSFSSLALHGEKRALYVRLSSLLRRLMPGEGKHEMLFHDFISGLRFLEHEITDIAEFKAFEALMVLRILRDLGYGGDDAFSDFLRVGQWDRGLLAEFSPLRDEALRHINRALKESHL